jgi:predicted phage tail protein
LVVRFAEAGSDAYPIESFDMTQYCTSRAHAFLVAQYFLSLRRRVTHTVKFRTSPFGISLAPGNFIRVVTESSPYQAANNGTISSDGTIVSATDLADGTYSIVFFKSDDDEVTPATMTVAEGKAVEPDLYDSLFTVSSTSTSSNVYMVEQLTLGEDGMVDVVATEFPATSTFNSLMASDVLDDAAFTTEG